MNAIWPKVKRATQTDVLDMNEMRANRLGVVLSVSGGRETSKMVEYG
jgi:hypothetical protein